MNIQERVLSTLKPLVASKGFGEKTLQGLATNLSGGLTEESTDEDVTEAIKGAMPMIDLMQSENTRYANEIKKKTQTQPNPSPAQQQEPNPTDPKPKGDDKIAELEKKIDRLLQINADLSLKEKWNKLADANGITNTTLINKWQPSNEEDIDSAMEELKAFNKDFVKQSANDKSPGKPNSGERTDATDKKQKELSGAGKKALEGFKKANERHAKKAS